MKRKIFLFFILSFCLLFNTHCAFYMMSKIKKINEQELASLKTSNNLLVRVNNIAYRLMDQLPQDERSRVAFTGLLLSDIDAYLRHIFSLDDEASGLLVIGVLENSPAQAAGFAPGDVIREINGEKTRDLFSSRIFLHRIRPQEELIFSVERGKTMSKISLTPVERFTPFAVGVFKSQVPDMGSASGFIFLTSSLIQTTQNDDELAFLLACALDYYWGLEETPRNVSPFPPMVTGVVAGIGATRISEPVVAVTRKNIEESFKRVYACNCTREYVLDRALWLKSAGFDPVRAGSFHQRTQKEGVFGSSGDFLKKIY